MLRPIILFVLMLCCASALALSQDEVMAGAGQMYRKRMTELQQRYMQLNQIFSGK